MNRLTNAAQKLAVGVQILFGQQQCLAFEVEAAARASMSPDHGLQEGQDRGVCKSPLAEDYTLSQLSLTTDKKGFKSVRDTPE